MAVFRLNKYVPISSGLCPLLFVLNQISWGGVWPWSFTPIMVLPVGCPAENIAPDWHHRVSKTATDAKTRSIEMLQLHAFCQPLLTEVLLGLLSARRALKWQQIANSQRVDRAKTVGDGQFYTEPQNCRSASWKTCFCSLDLWRGFTCTIVQLGRG